MSGRLPSREEAWALLGEYTKTDSLRKHARAVEAVMRAAARRLGENEELWGLVGLLHDFDYEVHPTREEHPLEGSEILRARGYTEEVIYAIQTHADYLGLPRRAALEKTLFAVDELTGFVVAVALVRPNRSLAEVGVSSVKKKLKDKAFARSVSREEIAKGVAELGVDLDSHVAFVIDSLREIAGELGLAGEAAS